MYFPMRKSYIPITTISNTIMSSHKCGAWGDNDLLGGSVWCVPVVTVRVVTPNTNPSYVVIIHVITKLSAIPIYPTIN